jgi:hypothetical protein
MAKNVVTNIFFQNYVISALSKPILKDVSINYIQIKVVQLPNNIIIKGNNYNKRCPCTPNDFIGF